jgi:hypothetical protein
MSLIGNPKPYQSIAIQIYSFGLPGDQLFFAKDIDRQVNGSPSTSHRGQYRLQRLQRPTTHIGSDLITGKPLIITVLFGGRSRAARPDRWI